MGRFITATLLGLLAFGATMALAAPSPQPIKVARPTTVIQPTGCVTADCHAGVKQYQYLHAPIAANTCDACHKLTDAKAHTFTISRQKADLCTYCHEFSTGVMPVVHKPVMTGQCLGCHNPHGGPAPSMMRQTSMAGLCGRCHDSGAMQKRFMHKPVKDGQCDTCHQPHASKYPKLLDAVGKDLCLYCHTSFKAQLDKAKFQHKAMDTSCGDCHDAHGSDFPKHVTKSLSDLCLGCHDKIKTDTAQAMYKHPAVLGDRACMTCHTAHGGDLAKLMSDLPIKICMTCHDKPIKSAKGQMIVAVSEVMAAETFKHGPIRDGQCGGCHSVHGGDRPLLLRKTNSDRFYENFSADKYELCFSCHDPLLAKEERAQGLTSFRNGEHNLHYAHVGMPPRGRNCRVCHATHASKYPQDIRDEVPFGKWKLPISFSKTQTGGSCQTGCHADYSYDRLKPVPSTRPATTLPIVRPTVDHDQPVLVKWSGKDLAGAKVLVPDPARPTVLLFLRADQPQSQQVVKMVAAAVPDTKRAQTIVILTGPQSLEHARELSLTRTIPWPIVPDEEGEMAKLAGVQVWPAALVVQRDAVVVAHVSGAPLSLSFELEAYLDFAADKLDRAALQRRLASRAVVSDSPMQKATWHLQMAEKLIAEGKHDQAYTMLTDGLKLQPQSLPLKVGLINTLVQLKKSPEALALLTQLPANTLPPWQQNLLRAKIILGDGQAAQAAQAAGLLTQTLKEKPDLTEAHYLLGRAYEQQNNWPKAAQEYRAAQEQRVQ